MKKLLLTLVIALSAGAPLVHSAPGIFGSGVELQTKQGAGLLTTTLYANNNSGTTRLLPTNSTATLNQTSFLTSPDTNPTFNLGTFLTTDTLTLKGFSVLTYVDSSTATQAYGNYRLFAGTTGSGAAFTGIALPYDANPTGNGSTDGRWDTEASNVNLLNGLSPGTYTLSVYYDAGDASNNFQYDSQNGSNYGATFTVAAAVPEPATWAISLLGGLGMIVLIRRHRLAVS